MSQVNFKPQDQEMLPRTHAYAYVAQP
jgi:hypothetical protein